MSQPDATITISVYRQPDGSLRSSSSLDGIDPANAGIVAIDVGRDLLVRSLNDHHHHSEEGQREQLPD